MLTIRKWLYKPKKSDHHPLGRFYFADLDLIEISKELDSFDGRQDPERCTALVNRLRTCQDRVLVIIEEILQDCLRNQRASREFRAKFPDDVLQETLWGQLWFGAECLAAGSVILNREIESAALRPLARFLTRTIDSLRMILRDQCYKNTTTYSEKVRNALRKFDEVFAEFELNYVSAMVPVKTTLEYDTLQDVIVMFCETVERVLSSGLITQDEVDDYDAALMMTIPRLAILCGLVIFPDGPLNMDNNPDNMSEVFRPFYQLLFKIRQLLRTLTTEEVLLLEKALCSKGGSWEEIEQRLEELHLSYEANGSYYDAHSYISPVESSVTECETACSSVPSLSLLEDRLRFDAGSWCDPAATAATPGSHEANRKLSLQPTGTSVPDDEIEACPAGHAKSEGITIPSQKRRRRRSQPPPVVSPDSPEGVVATKETRKRCSKRKSSSESERKGSGGEIDPLVKPISGVSPQCNDLDGDHTTHNGVRAAEGAILKREDSGLGTPSYCCSTEATSPEYPSILSSLCREGVSGERDAGAGRYCQNLCLSPQQDKGNVQSAEERTNPQHGDISRKDKDTDRGNLSHEDDPPPRSDGNTPQSDIFREDKNTKRNKNGAAQPSDIFREDKDTDRRNVPHPGKGETIPDGGLLHEGNGIARGNSVELNDVNNVSSGDDIDGFPSLVMRVPIHEGNENDGGNSVELEDVTNSSDDTDGFPAFGKGVPSTQLSTVGSTGTAIHDVFDHETDIHSLMWATVDSAPAVGRVASQGLVNEVRLRNPSGSSTGSNIQTTSGMNRVTGLLGLAGAATNMNLSDGGSIDSCGSSCSCCSYSGDEDQQEYQWESDDSDSESSLTDNMDAQEIKMAIQAAEIAARQEVRSQFSSSSDIVHRLFVCIAGVADHLQTNYASDLRGILKTVFEVCAKSPTHNGALPPASAGAEGGAAHGTGDTAAPSAPAESPEGGTRRRRHRSNGSRNRTHSIEEPPPWTPDVTATHCLACQAAFTVLRRKHHCRNCGKIFCARCSANAVPLPRYGQSNPVRVCNRCYMYQVTPFQP